MSTNIHVSGLSCFCTDDKLRQAFLPFGAVVLAHVLRDECGHALGLGIVHMDRSEDAADVLNAQPHIEIAGSRVLLWKPAEPELPRSQRIAAHDLRARPAGKIGRDTSPKNDRNRFQRLAVPRHRLIWTPSASSPIAPSLSTSRVN